MKSFFLRLLKLFFTFWLAAALFVFSAAIVVGVLIASFSPKPVAIQDQTVLIWNLGTTITDGPQDADPLQTILNRAQGGETEDSISLREMLTVMKDASSDRRIGGLLIRGNFSTGGGISLAHLREVRDAVEAFQASGKPVFAHFANDGMAEILIKSMADVVTIEPTAILDFRGFGVVQLFFADLLKELGIEVHTFNVGDFKSFTEVFTRTSMSDPERLQLQEVLATRWDLFVDLLRANGSVDVDALLAHMQEVPFISAAQSVELGLAQEIRPYIRMIEQLQQTFAVDDEGTGYRRIGLVTYRDRNPDAASVLLSMMENSPHLAVLYAEGPIVNGNGNSSQIGGSSLASRLRDLRLDDNVRAVVLRVNSPGGSAFASEQILNELVRLNERKPVVVSMGPVAASGGYYIAARAHSIFADPFTVTGSIGVAGIIFSPHQLLKDFGIHSDAVTTAPFADMGNPGRAWNESELASLQLFSEAVYDDFLRHVAEGRNRTIEEARALAGGRIYSGQQALELGLVDHLGGLEAAIAYAARAAAMGDQFEVVEYPRRLSFEERIMEFFQTTSPRWLTQLASHVPGLKPHAQQISADVEWMLTNPDPRNIYLLDVRTNLLP